MKEKGSFCLFMFLCIPIESAYAGVSNVMGAKCHSRGEMQECLVVMCEKPFIHTLTVRENKAGRRKR